MKKKEIDTEHDPIKVMDDLITVTLKRQHTHAGQVHDAGETLQVNAAMRRWLIYQGVIDTNSE